MEAELERGEHTQVTTTVEEFCKAFVHLIHIEIGEPLKRDIDVKTDRETDQRSCLYTLNRECKIQYG